MSEKTLGGNPYFKQPSAINGPGDVDTLLRAVAYELRTANLIAAYANHSATLGHLVARDELANEIAERLGK